MGSKGQTGTYSMEKEQPPLIESDGHLGNFETRPGGQWRTLGSWNIIRVSNRPAPPQETGEELDQTSPPHVVQEMRGPPWQALHAY